MSQLGTKSDRTERQPVTERMFETPLTHPSEGDEGLLSGFSVAFVKEIHLSSSLPAFLMSCWSWSPCSPGRVSKAARSQEVVFSAKSSLRSGAESLSLEINATTGLRAAWPDAAPQAQSPPGEPMMVGLQLRGPQS